MAILQIAPLTAHISFLLWELIIWQTRSWQIYPPSNGNFTDSCSDSPPALRGQHLTDQVLADLPPVNWQFYRLLLWQLIFHSYSESSTFGWPGLGRSNPTIKWKFLRFLWNSYFIPTLRAQHLADQVMADLSPIKWQFHWFLLWQLLFDSYSESLSFGRPGLGISTPPSNGDFTDSCSDSSLL